MTTGYATGDAVAYRNLCLLTYEVFARLSIDWAPLLHRSAATPNPVIQMEQKLLGALGEHDDVLLRVPMGGEQVIQAPTR